MFKRILVTGGAGYVGSEVVKLYLKDTTEVLVFDSFSSGDETRLPKKEKNLTIQKGSLTNASAIEKAVKKFKPDLVFHMAAVHYIPQCVADPDLVIQTNIQGTTNLLHSLQTLETEPKLIFVSSASVYGEVVPAPQRTSASVQPCDIYGYSKAIGEHLVSSRYENYVIARLFNVFGDNDPIPHLIPSIVSQLHQEVIELGAADTQRDFIYVKDAARAFAALADQGKVHGIYNIGSGICYSVKQVAQRLKKLSGSNAKLVFQVTERRDTDPKTLCADLSDIVRDTSWRPTISLDEGLKTALRSRTQASHKPSSSSLPSPLAFTDYIAVISDFDDTLLDNNYDAERTLHGLARIEALQEIEQLHKIHILDKLTPDMIESSIINAPFHVSEAAFWWLLTETGHIDKHKTYNPKHPLVIELEEAKQRAYIQLLTTEAKAIHGAPHFFKLLHENGFAGKIAIASSASKADITYFLNNHGFQNIIPEHHIIAREDVKKFKPHPESFKKAMSSLSISSGDAYRVLVFEDDPKGIVAAKQLGLTTCALTTRFTREELLVQPIKPDFIAKDFNEYATMFGLKQTGPAWKKLRYALSRAASKTQAH